MKWKKKRIMWIFISIIFLLGITVVSFLNQPSFGRKSSGERLERVNNSPNYRDGKFQNIHETKQLTSDKGFVRSMVEFLFRKDPKLAPTVDIPVVKTDLSQIDKDSNVIVWFGHSSYLLQINRKRFLIDPVFHVASPVSFFNKAFKGTGVFKTEDIPEIDYLVISHDHWDHLDYQTVVELKDKVAKVICPLGVGEHFEYWGYDKKKLIELDWNEYSFLDGDFKVRCYPARHFSGRGLSPNGTLWASYLLETPTQNIYIGGDGGYDNVFAEIGKKHDIDLAILENGQYNEDWRYIHLLPDDLVKAIKDLNPKKVLAVHHSKYALGKHPWDEPMTNISNAAEKNDFNLMTPQIGEVMNLNDTIYSQNKWWENVE